MLENKPGVIKVKKLRAILMMEVDYHGMNKAIIGQRMMQFAERHNYIEDECSSSRRDHEAINVAINMKLIRDLFQQKLHTGAISSVDLEWHTVLQVSAVNGGVSHYKPCAVCYSLSNLWLSLFAQGMATRQFHTVVSHTPLQTPTTLTHFKASARAMEQDQPVCLVLFLLVWECLRSTDM